MKYQNPALDALTGPGQHFEVADIGDKRFFRNAPVSLYALIETARRHGQATGIVDGERRLTYQDIFDQRDALAGKLGVGAKQNVAIAMKNCAAWMIAFLAVLRIGAVPVLVNSRMSGPEMRASLEECECVLVLADDARLTLLREAGYAGRLMAAGDFPTAPSSVVSLPLPTPAPDDPAAILFTSGTTGRVKGAVLSHRNLVTGLMCVQLSGAAILHGMAKKYGTTVEAIMSRANQAASILVFPLFHISGLGSGFLSQLLAGGKIVVMSRWDAGEALRVVESEKITMFTAVPTMLWDLLHCPQFGNTNLSSLGSVSSGGQGLPLNLLEAVRKAIPHAVLGSGFGLTETSGAIAMSMGDDFLRKPASGGRVLALADVRILDENNQELPVGVAGEIVVKGPMVMQGYWGRPAETSQVLDGDGWFRTGDIGYVDDEGYVFIVDRKKDMVISGGENIYCAEVERVVSQIPKVTEVAAFGLPDERLGEKLVCVMSAQDVTEEAVRAFVAKELASYKAPVRVVFSGEPLPRNAAGKIDKIKLRAMWPVLSKEI